MNLFKLTDEWITILDTLADSDNLEADEGLHSRLADLADAFEKKIENIGKVIRTLDAHAKAYKAEEERLAARRKTVENRIASLKTYAQSNMEAAGIDKVAGELLTVAVQNNPESVQVEDEAKIPPTFWIEQAPTLDKAGIKAALQRGEKIDGATLTRTRSLRIR